MSIGYWVTKIRVHLRDLKEGVHVLTGTVVTNVIGGLTLVEFIGNYRLTNLFSTLPYRLGDVYSLYPDYEAVFTYTSWIITCVLTSAGFTYVTLRQLYCKFLSVLLYQTINSYERMSILI